MTPEPPAPGLDASHTHLVLIPSFNPGDRLGPTVRGARARWNPVWVVVDGSTDGTAERLTAMAAADPGLTVLTLTRNQGKGAAVLHGIRAAALRGFTHVLTMDSDGQHPAELIPEFMSVSQAHPGAMVLGLPVFDSSAPRARVYGRRLSNAAVDLETLGAGIGDSLFGFRVYPIAPLLEVMEEGRWMRRFDFDAEVAVRLCWRGVEPINRPAPVRYLRAEEGGVSHFSYVRDNALLTWMHLRLFLGFLCRLPGLLAHRR
jgi:glycosyltransferase involved in cell wall biosynthesis